MRKLWVFAHDFSTGETKHREVFADSDGYKPVCEDAVDGMIDICNCDGIWGWYMADKLSFEQASKDFEERVLMCENEFARAIDC